MRHLANVHRRRTAEKRGGSMPLLSIDAPFAEVCLSRDLPHKSLPDEAFDGCWAQSILESALKKLKLWYYSKDRGNLFEALHPFLEGSDRQDATGKYHAVAAELGVNETSLRTALFQMRKRYRTMIENEIRETMASPAAAGGGTGTFP